MEQGSEQQLPTRMIASVDGTHLRAVPDMSKTEEIIRVRKKRKKVGKGKKTLLGIAIFLISVVLLAGIAAALFINSIDNAMSFKNEETADQVQQALAPVATQNTQEPFYMLLLGSDARETDTASRSDVMILLRADPEEGTLTMVSIPRDTMVDIPGYGRSKINAAYAYGGAAGAIEAVSTFAGVPISHYAEIHFKELEQMVDKLGGIWVNVPVSNDQTGSSNTGLELNAGEQLLNGAQALALARERYGYERGDFQRGDNQRLIVEAIVKQVLAASPADLPGTIHSLAECVSTDYKVTDLVPLAQEFRKAGSLTFYSAMVPSSTATIDGVSYTITDETAWADMMAKVDQGEDPGSAARENEGL